MAKGRAERSPPVFFSAFLTYLPESQNRKDLEAIIGLAGLVAFSEADFKVSSGASGRMKVFLHIRIPDYNFNLNLNVEIHEDSGNIFEALSQLTQALGFQMS